MIKLKQIDFPTLRISQYEGNVEIRQDKHDTILIEEENIKYMIHILKHLQSVISKGKLYD